MLRFPRTGRLGLVAAAGLLAVALASCSDYAGVLPKANRPLDSKTRDLVERKGMDQQSPILIRIFKEDSKLEVWKQVRSTGKLHVPEGLRYLRLVGRAWSEDQGG